MESSSRLKLPDVSPASSSCKLFPYVCLKSSAISRLCLNERLTVMSIRASSSVPQPFIASCKAFTSSSKTLSTSSTKLTSSNSGKFKVSDKMIKERTHRFKTYKPEVPYKLPEGIPINRSFVSTGCPDKFAMMRYRCRKEGVTIGNLALACTWMAMAQVIPGGKFSNMNYIDYPVNMRTRLGIGDAYCGFMVSEIMPRAKDVDQETSLWKLAKTMEKQVKQMLSEDQHFAFTGEVKKKFETGKATAETAAVPVENLLDVLLSNMMRYKAPLEPYPGLYIKGSYIPGGIWAPGFGNYLLLFQSTDRMHYTAVYNEPNAAVCDDLFDSWVMLMENAAHVKEGEDTFAKIKAKNGLVEKCF